jgi:DNA-binding cell septation regulator SpoVG
MMSSAPAFTPSGAPRVLSLRHNPKGNLRGFASIDFGNGLIVYDFRLIHQPGQKMYISLPQREWLTPSGEKRFTPAVEISKPLKALIDALIFEAWEASGEEVDRG